MQPSNGTKKIYSHEEIEQLKGKVLQLNGQLKKSKHAQIGLILANIMTMATAIFLYMWLTDKNDQLLEKNQRLWKESNQRAEANKVLVEKNQNLWTESNRLVETNKVLGKILSEAGPPAMPGLSTLCEEAAANGEKKCKIFSPRHSPATQTAIIKRLHEVDKGSFWSYREEAPLDCRKDVCYYGDWKSP